MSRTQSRKKPTHRPRPLPVSRSAPPGVRGGSWGRRLRWLAASLFLLSAIPVLVLRWLPPPTSMFMLIERASALLDGDRQYRIHYRWVGWDAISPQAKLAVVASEDQTFARHLGFDFSDDFTPPLSGGSRATVRLAIPASLTHTELDLGVLRGEAQAAIALQGSGRVGFDFG